MNTEQVTYGPGAGPAPRNLTDDALARLVGAQTFGVLATNKSNGHPHLSTVLYSWDPGERVIRISTTADRVKVRHLTRDPRAALHVSSDDHWSFAVAEGKAELSPTTTTPGDETGRELLAMAPPFDRSEDVTAFLEQMVKDHRQVIRIHVDHLYGTILDIPT